VLPPTTTEENAMTKNKSLLQQLETVYCDAITKVSNGDNEWFITLMYYIGLQGVKRDLPHLISGATAKIEKYMKENVN
jgi:hypothetical protein